MSPAQRFFSFAEGAQKGQGREVDILGELHLATADGEPLPSLTVRMVPGQIDDILVAAPDLDKLGFDSGAADVFVLHGAGLSIPRETNIPTVPIRSTMVEDAVHVYLRETVMLRPHESRLVSVQTNDTTTEVLTGWLRAEEDDSFRVPEGPIELTAAALNVLVHNPTDDWVELEQNKTVARVVRTSDEDEVLADALHQLDVEDFGYQNACPDDDMWQATGGSEKVVDAGRSHPSISDIRVGGRVGRREDERLRKVKVSGGATTASLISAATLAEGPKHKPALEKPVWKQWRRLLLLVLFTMQLPWRRLDVDMRSAMIRSGTADTETETSDERQWEDLRSPEYKGALLEHFETHRNERYSHLSEHRLTKLRALVKDHSEVFVIDGVVPTTVSGYEFDIELEPGAKPVRQQLPKLAPQAVAKERYHVLKEEQLGHLRVPDDEAKSDWATRTHVVSKKGDPNGRWICDFRPLNRVTVKRCTAIGDVFSKTRSLASKRWKSGLDAWSGFNQLKATERASRLLQIITSFGVRQWTVLPFGVTNGPSYFQEFMLTLYGGSKHGPDMLGESMSDLDAIMEVWIDDVQLGSGSLDDKTAREKDDLDLNDGSDGFDQHLEALGRVLKRASLANLRFKLDKCYFAQYSLETLGMIAGNGVVKADPKKVQGIVSWPRPTRIEDVEKFLATTVFIREHLSPQYSQLSKPLRDVLVTLQENRRKGYKSRAQPVKPPPDDGKVESGEVAWPSFWSEACEQAFNTLKRLVTHSVDLQVPDFKGAERGDNLFHIWPDACAYGIGGGLFQGYPQDSTAPPSYYTVIGVPTWATKAEIVAKYGELKRASRRHSGVDLETLEQAYEVLCDVSKRGEYDESIGLAEKRRSRIDLRPLGFFSKSSEQGTAELAYLGTGTFERLADLDAFPNDRYGNGGGHPH